MLQEPTLQQLKPKDPRYKEARTYLEEQLQAAYEREDGTIVESRFPAYDHAQEKPVDGEDEWLMTAISPEGQVIGTGRYIQTPEPEKLKTFNTDPRIYDLKVQEPDGTTRPIRIGFLSGLAVKPEWRHKHFTYQGHERYPDNTSIGTALAIERIQPAWDDGVDVLLTVCREASQHIYRARDDFIERGSWFPTGINVEKRMFVGINPKSGISQEEVMRHIGYMTTPLKIIPPETTRPQPAYQERVAA